MSKRRRISWLIVIATLLVVAALFLQGMPAVALHALRNSDRFELFVLDPRASDGGFHGHAILGQTLITDRSVQLRLTDALQSGARWNNGSRYLCFNPRHGIRVTRGGQVIDMLICFECRQVYVFRGETRISVCTVSEAPQATFDAVLRQAGVAGDRWSFAGKHRPGLRLEIVGRGRGCNCCSI
ncbi:hypothetical protein BH09PLA1_BH09PLA1_18910 [soil metagenome]